MGTRSVRDKLIGFVLLVSIFLGLCASLVIISFLVLSTLDNDARQKQQNQMSYLRESIKIGMTRSEVYRQIEEIGNYQVTRHANLDCSAREKKIDGEVILSQSSAFMSRLINLSLCFDRSVVLIEDPGIFDFSDL